MTLITHRPRKVLFCVSSFFDEVLSTSRLSLRIKKEEDDIMRSQLFGFEGRVIYAVHHFGFLGALRCVYDSEVQGLRTVICRVLILVVGCSLQVLLFPQQTILSMLRIQPSGWTYTQPLQECDSQTLFEQLKEELDMRRMFAIFEGYFPRVKNTQRSRQTWF